MRTDLWEKHAEAAKQHFKRREVVADIGAAAKRSVFSPELEFSTVTQPLQTNCRCRSKSEQL